MDDAPWCRYNYPDQRWRTMGDRGKEGVAGSTTLIAEVTLTGGQRQPAGQPCEEEPLFVLTAAGVWQRRHPPLLSDRYGLEIIPAACCRHGKAAC